MAAGNSGSTSLEHTPTWALATVCLCIVSISMVLEHSIHLLSNLLKKHRKTALNEAVLSLKSVLMFLGFMSLLLAVTQDYVTKICIPIKAANTMLPCRGHVMKPGRESFVMNTDIVNGSSPPYSSAFSNGSEFNNDDDDANATDSCASKGTVSLMTKKGIQQLQVFIFIIAVTQIVYSVFTLALGRLKMRRWTAWEKETQTLEYQVAHDPNRFRFTRATTFGRRHEACTETALQLWTKSFFRQFFNSVAKVDYLTLRHGFINAHLSDRFHDFNFQKYIESSLDEDFKVVVSISPFLWFLVVLFMLIDVYGWHSYLWLSYVPLLIILILGTKLEVIVAKMAVQLKSLNNVTMGAPLVQPNNDLFWFGQPRFVLHLLHLTLFVNAFEFSFFLWVIIQFGYHSCHHEHTAITITRIVFAVSVQVLCSYITLPLYALVTQMGSEFRGELINEHVVQVLKQWHAEVRDKRKKQAHVVAPSVVLSSDGGGGGGSPDSEVAPPTRRDLPCLIKQITCGAARVSEITEEEEGDG
ncbi:MLO-like protein 3 isoform X1 [Andrographis paniculata]|uniref:MLO-like protein 3 isoform X1 n=1 Tax=Andrographis paniculata TaxID=175694 RepID=UPI0021E78CDB|nr:MLO-like protein 3 isoform X1 [Andrographis paniculata]